MGKCRTLTGGAIAKLQELPELLDARTIYSGPITSPADTSPFEKWVHTSFLITGAGERLKFKVQLRTTLQ